MAGKNVRLIEPQFRVPKLLQQYPPFVLVSCQRVNAAQSQATTKPSKCGGIGTTQHASLSLHDLGFGGFRFLVDVFEVFFEKLSSCSHSCTSFDCATLCRSNCGQGQGGDFAQTKRLERPAGDESLRSLPEPTTSREQMRRGTQCAT